MKPIIFSAPMVQAILAGKKIQTRRVIKPQPDIDQDGWVSISRPSIMFPSLGAFLKQRSPYHPGDILWVRETWQETDVCHAGGGYDLHTKFVYRADFQPEEGVRTPEKWRSPIYMPKEAARIFLRVTGVGAERLQEISCDDAIAEGTIEWICEEHKSGTYIDNAMRGAACAKPERAFALLWDSLNAKRGYGWDKNPWVWVIEFRRLNNA